MARSDAFRRGACPSAGAPMESGDGLISRIRLPAGYLSADQLAGLATLSRQHGQGMLELTSRGNLQIRGLTESSERQLTRELVAAGLAVADPDAEACRNIQSSPGSDVDAMAIADTRALAGQLDARLKADPSFHRLPPKFRFVLNGGGKGQLADVDGDVRADAVTTPNGAGYRLGLAGTAYSATPLGLCHQDNLIDALLELARVFLALNKRLLTPMRRMSGLLDAQGNANAFRELIGSSLWPTPPLPEYPTPMKPGPLGNGFVAGVPLGRLDAALAHTLADISLKNGSGEIRTTPWRQVLIRGHPERLGPQLHDLGLITDPADPRNSIVTCPGSPECGSGTTSTRDHALAWAEAVPECFDGESVVHVSGCAKGCARPRQSPITLVAREGVYDLILNDRAWPEDENSRITSGLKPKEVPDALRALKRGSQ